MVLGFGAVIWRSWRGFWSKILGAYGQPTKTMVHEKWWQSVGVCEALFSWSRPHGWPLGSPFINLKNSKIFAFSFRTPMKETHYFKRVFTSLRHMDMGELWKNQNCYGCVSSLMLVFCYFIYPPITFSLLYMCVYIYIFF